MLAVGWSELIQSLAPVEGTDQQLLDPISKPGRRGRHVQKEDPVVAELLLNAFEVSRLGRVYGLVLAWADVVAFLVCALVVLVVFLGWVASGR